MNLWGLIHFFVEILIIHFFVEILIELNPAARRPAASKACFLFGLALCSRRQPTGE